VKLERFYDKPISGILVPSKIRAHEALYGEVRDNPEGQGQDVRSKQAL
jgi:hypothetical protein